MVIGGEGTTAGTGGKNDTAHFRIVAASPANRSTKVEREALTVKVTFSERLDAAAIDSSSLTVRGPDGALDGKVEVSGENDHLSTRRAVGASCGLHHQRR